RHNCGNGRDNEDGSKDTQLGKRVGAAMKDLWHVPVRCLTLTGEPMLALLSRVATKNSIGSQWRQGDTQFRSDFTPSTGNQQSFLSGFGYLTAEVPPPFS